MKAAEARGRATEELEGQLLQLRKERFNLRFQKATGQLEKTGRVKIVRRDIARILTQLHERKRAADQAQASGRENSGRAGDTRGADRSG